ncbi:MAG: hypothetical protein ISS48_04345, partial [Candidatus Aenigmarchaeota archaeon]|nr:hypothetical protein [Candidatus Aenigmarchaeota archaeon]
MEAGIIGMIAIGLVVLVTSLMIIKSLGYEVQINFVKRMKETLSNLYSQVLGREYYNPCEAYNE